MSEQTGKRLAVDGFGDEYEDANGRYRLNSDYEALEAKLATLEAERDQALASKALMGDFVSRLSARIFEASDMSLSHPTDVELQLVRMIDRNKALEAERDTKSEAGAILARQLEIRRTEHDELYKRFRTLEAERDALKQSNADFEQNAYGFYWLLQHGGRWLRNRGLELDEVGPDDVFKEMRLHATETFADPPQPPDPPKHRERINALEAEVQKLREAISLEIHMHEHSDANDVIRIMGRLLAALNSNAGEKETR